MADKKRQSFPEQHQEQQPGRRDKMAPKPELEDPHYKAAGKLHGMRALVTGGDSGIGAATAIAFAKEGADVAIVYLEEHEDARNIQRRIEELGQKCVTIAGDVGGEGFCQDAVARAVDALGGLDVVVNNAAEQHYVESLEDLSEEQLVRTFRTNIFGYFFVLKHALPHLSEGASVINTTSVTAYKGNAHLIDYSSTKGAIVAFTRTMSQVLAKKKIRVNAVAPGPVWTPLIPASFPEEDVATFGQDYPLGRAAQPSEIAPTFVFLAAHDSLPMTGQVLHPNMGKLVGS